ncbi:MAG: enoyl-CoA hydratase/isomerase family protein [Herminiimonas sp.]|uniref:enoyl-CoA hydratase/isomerase family protein n=1 Tax=Herminiimonas sp. TaxID=1926289 RepID=UPI002717DEB3|nr:enoyl-CoA hydratase/isomerase family protein [Herminiimonas sp.]MDO9421634.1 enoyl-CoA hydratase/isomerase family protein [Herminiimonas sp.]MDO9422011.1 enoyl-CoA hydratase/isomerase family protein [Herminiimonas sp.]
MQTHIHTSTKNGLGCVILDRPAALNSLSLEMIRALAQTLSSWREAPDVNAILILSTLPKAFCAGGDIHFFHEVAKAGLTGGSALLEDFFTEEYALNHLIHHYPKPYIAILDGIVMGGGMGISQSSESIRIVTERTRMAMPEVNIGLFPDVGGGYFLSRLPGELGTYLGLTGEIIGTDDTLYANLADIFVPRAKLPALITLIESVDDHQYREAIEAFAAPFAAQINPANSMLAKQRHLIDHHFSHDNVAAITSSLAQDDDPFAQKTLATILKRSPLMVCVSLEQIRRSAKMELADCLRLERTMVRRCFEHGETVEGIRALVIDKDNAPQWRPASLQEVTPKMIAPFFTPAWPDYAHPLRDLV